MYYSIVLSYFLVFLTINVHGHSKYVPSSEEVCDTMEPHHHKNPQKTPPPYKILIKDTKATPGQSLYIYLLAEEQLLSNGTLLKLNEHHHKNGFKGFYIQARETKRQTPIGSFTPTEDNSVKTHDCGYGYNNAAFHGVKGHKTNVTIRWTAPQNFSGKVIFTTTFVRKYHKFWTKVKSKPLSIKFKKLTQ